jgi:hypothetical protein
MPSFSVRSIQSWFSHQRRARRHDDTLGFATSAKPESSESSRLASPVDRVVAGPESPRDGDRVELASEALVGAKWLLMLASQALEGSQTLLKEARDIEREYNAISSLCEVLSAPGMRVERTS